LKTLTGIWVGALLGAVAVGAKAELSVSTGIEYLNWAEDTSPKVTEKGPLFAFGLNWTQDKSDGPLFAYRGKIYLGSVDYEGADLVTNAPLSGSTEYTGMEHEAQIRLRKVRGDYTFEPLLGVGINTWNRQLSSIQKELYVVGYARAGVEFKRSEAKGIDVGFGIRYPFYVDENAYFNETFGSSNNPHLEPKGRLSAFANIGYRFTDNLQLTGYYESIKFDDSDPVIVNCTCILSHGAYQPASTMNILGVKLQYRFPAK
jgi:hypothetical protein